MKALTLRHPWPFCICRWNKRIENRTWRPPQSLIGQRIAIHGGKVPPQSQHYQIRNIIHDLYCEHGLPAGMTDIKLDDVFACTGIVATAVIDRVIAFGDDDICEQDPWFEKYPGNYGWILTDVIVLPEPIPCRGAQGLWTVPDEIVERLPVTPTGAV